MEDVELPENVDQCSLTEGIRDAGAVSYGRVAFAEIFHPFGNDPYRNQVGLVDQEDDMLVREVFLDVLLKS
jgi:hypothetical protein